MPFAARVNDLHLCPKTVPAGPVQIPQIGGMILSPGEPTVKICGEAAAREGDKCVCICGPPNSIKKGSTTVNIGGKPAARMGDPTAHDGSIVLGAPTVNIGG